MAVMNIIKQNNEHNEDSINSLFQRLCEAIIILATNPPEEIQTEIAEIDKKNQIPNFFNNLNAMNDRVDKERIYSRILHDIINDNSYLDNNEKIKKKVLYEIYSNLIDIESIIVSKKWLYSYNFPYQTLVKLTRIVYDLYHSDEYLNLAIFDISEKDQKERIKEIFQHYYNALMEYRINRVLNQNAFILDYSACKNIISNPYNYKCKDFSKYLPTLLEIIQQKITKGYEIGRFTDENSDGYKLEFTMNLYRSPHDLKIIFADQFNEYPALTIAISYMDDYFSSGIILPAKVITIAQAISIIENMKQVTKQEDK